MGDPRNVAHAKKVSQEKIIKKACFKGRTCSVAAAQERPNRKESCPCRRKHCSKAQAATPTQPVEPTQLEKSLVVLSNLKDLEFHSRANIEKLAELSLTIEEELKQKPFAEGIGAVFAAQNAFQSKILELIGTYEKECARLSGSA